VKAFQPRSLLLLLAVAAGMTAGVRTAHAQTPPPHVHLMPPPSQGATLRPAAPAGVNLLYHGGPVVHTGKMYAIYWLPPGALTSPTYQTLINRYFTDIGGTPFYNILSQYPDGCCPTTNTSTLGGTWVDTRPYLHAGTVADPLLDSDIQAEVLHAVATQPGWAPGPDAAFFVFTGRDVYSCLDASKTVCSVTQYCAYHGSFTSGATNVLYSNMPDAGTGICSAGPGPNGDDEADGEISLVSHEHFETVNDPLPDVNTAWSDSSGYEIADKCSFDFGTLNPDNSNVLLHGHPYRVQREWSNQISGCTLEYFTLAVGGVGVAPDLRDPVLRDAAALTRSSGRAFEVEAGVAGLMVLGVVVAWFARRHAAAARGR
jgi:hypothetical protein